MPAPSKTIMFRDGYLTEGSSSNVFVVKNGVHARAAEEQPGAAGHHLRRRARDCAARASSKSKCAQITEAEVRSADEIWVTSSTKEVLAVTTLDGKPVGDGKPGTVFRRMHQLYQEFKRDVMRAK